MASLEYEYNGKKHPVNWFCDLYQEIHGKEISYDSMSYRLKNRETPSEALGFESKSEEVDFVECPDGVGRTYLEIASMLGLTYSTFMVRKSNHGLKKAIAMGAYGV